MSSEKKVSQFPDVGSKLQAPSKKSVFERQKAEAEAKRLREEAETKAVYEDFVKSFDDEDDAPGGGFRSADSGPGVAIGGPRLGGFGGAQSKRHFTQGAGAPTGPAAGRGFGANLGRGGLGSGVGSLGPPPPSLGRKRAYEGFTQTSSKREDRGVLSFDDYEHPTPSKILSSLDTDDESSAIQGRAEERAVPKPTLRLASLAPGTSPAFIKALIPQNLTVDAVKILPPTGPGVSTERKSMSAIVTLAKETAANDIDTAVNALQNKYLGFGYYLNLHRHLSSAALSSSATIPGLGASTTTAQPFGAKPVVLPSAGRGHAPPGHQRGFAPPTSYAPNSAPQLNRNLLYVPVQAPRDIRELKLIHKVIESLIKHGPEFEALLMSRPDVQREEKWAWLWDPRSTGGVWYRWRLWEVLTGSQTRRGQGRYLPLFEGSSAWKSPDQPLAFEYTTNIDEFVSDSEYNSSDDDESGDEGARKPHHVGTGPPPESTASAVDDGKAYLNPLEKAKLTHLLARLPTSTGRLRKGDVARVTAFAISHAGQGADEIVSMIISNIKRPFAYTSANPDRRKEKDHSGDDGGDGANDDEEMKSDTSSASLIAIYIISDILSSSSTSGVRHAWRYRQLFESALKQRKVFEEMGRMERKMNWGKLKAEKWKRSVGNVLSLWEGWCVFPQESQEGFTRAFRDPPLTEPEEKEAREKEVAVEDKGKSKWKAVEVAPLPTPAIGRRNKMEEDEDVDGEPMDQDEEDVDGVPMEEDEGDVDGVMMDADGDADGLPMVEDDEMRELLVQLEGPAKGAGPSQVKDTVPVGKQRRRPKAVDMFADSDDED